MCPACLRGSMTAGPDEVRVPGPSQTIELLSPDTTSGFPGYGPVDHHHSHLPLQRYVVARWPRCFLVAWLRGHRGTIRLPACEDNPGDAGGFVGDSDGDQSCGFALEQAAHPGPGCRWIAVGAPDH